MEGVDACFFRPDGVQTETMRAIRSICLLYTSVRGFIPASRLDAAYVEDLDSWNGKKIPVLVIEADEEKKRLVLRCV